MLTSDQFNRNLAKSLESAPIEFRRRGKGLYRVSPCKAHSKAVAYSAFRQSMAHYLNLVDDGGTVVISRRPGMGSVVVYYLVEKVKAGEYQHRKQSPDKSAFVWGLFICDSLV